jgi:hypothetical protein
MASSTPLPIIPAIRANGVVLVGPSADGTDGQVLTTDGSGNLSFETASGGGGSYTDEEAQDAVGGILSASFSYDDATPAIALSSAVLASLTKADTATQPGDLATVATTGDYDDLTNKPTLDYLESGDNVSELTNDAGYITGYTVTEGDVTTHEAALSITESQITDLGSYLVAADITGKQDKPSEGAFVDGDKTKLDGIEAAADVTDATNVAAAGAVMESDTSTASMSFVIDEDDMSSDSATKVPTQQSVKAFVESRPYYIEVALSTNGENIASGTFKGFARVHTAGNITGLVIDCDPNNEPSASSVQVDLNTVDRSTGTATSVLSAVATIATSANTGTGTVDGTQAVSAGDLLSFDVDQGSDGQDLIATVEITPT